MNINENIERLMIDFIKIKFKYQNIKKYRSIDIIELERHVIQQLNYAIRSAEGITASTQMLEVIHYWTSLGIVEDKQKSAISRYFKVYREPFEALTTQA